MRPASSHPSALAAILAPLWACGVSGSVAQVGENASSGSGLASGSASSAAGPAASSGATPTASAGASSGSRGASSGATGSATATATTSSQASASSGSGASNSASASSGAGASSTASVSSGAGASTSGSASGSSSGSSSGGSSSGTYTDFVGVLMRGNDLAHDAVYTDPAFTKATVGASTLKVDATFTSPGWDNSVYAAPLYFVNDNSGKDLVVIVTEGNEVYALDAADGSVVWSRVPLVSPAGGGAMNCGNIGPPLGITGTPVIDPATRTLFLGAVTTLSSGKGDHRIYALSMDDGHTLSGWPVDVEGLRTTLGNGQSYTFVSADNGQRGALLFLNGTVYVPYGGLFGDCGSYHGAVVAVPENNPSSATLFATTVHQAGIWAPGGIASDGTNLFVATGNGDGSDEGNSIGWLGGEGILKLGPGATFSNQATDYFAPTDYLSLDQGDTDLGSAAPVLFDFNDARTGLRHLIFDMGKSDNAYLVDQTNLGGIEGEISGPTVTSGWQFGSYAAYHTNSGTYVTYNGSYNGTGSCPGGGNGNLIALGVNQSTSSTPITATVAWCGANNDIAAPLVTVSSGTNDALVWSVGGNQLYAYDGDTGAIVGSVGVGSIQYWNTPIVAKGRMFMTANSQTIAVIP